MINTIFHGDKAEFEDAKTDGDVWSDPDEPGKYQYAIGIKAQTKTDKQVRSSKEKWDVKDQKDFRAGMYQFMLEDLPSATWMPEKTSGKAARKALNDNMADETDYQLLQNCNDAMTTVTLALKRMAPDIMKVANTDVCRKLAKDTIELLKKAASPGEVVTELLMTPMGEVTKLQAEESLIAAGKCYEDLLAIHSQCKNMIKVETKKGGASSSSGLRKLKD